LSELQVEKSGTASTSFGNGKKVEGYASVVQKEQRPGDTAQNNMFIVAEAGVLCVCEQRQMWSIRSMRDASVGIPWIGSGAAGKAAFMLVREVSDSADMMIPGRVGYY
jgi:hypothetical protein